VAAEALAPGTGQSLGRYIQRYPRARVEPANRLDELLNSFPTLWFETIKTRFVPMFGKESCFQNKLLKCMACFMRECFYMWGKNMHNLEVLPQ